MGSFDQRTLMSGTGPLLLSAIHKVPCLGSREGEWAGAVPGSAPLNRTEKPYASSSSVTATSALADRRTVSPSTPAIRPFEI